MLGDYVPEVVEQQIKLILKESKENEGKEDPHALVFLGNLYAQIEDEAKAEEYYQRAIKSYPDIASGYFGLGVLYQKQEKLDDAINMYQEAVACSKWNERYLNNLAYVYFLKEEFGKAISTYELVLKLDYEYLLPYCEIALAHRLMGDLAMARNYQYRLVELLNNQKISVQQKNNDVWFFETGKGIVSLFTIIQKKFYAIYSLSMSLFLLGQEKEAKHLTQKAKNLDVEKEDAIMELIKSDLTNFSAKNEKYQIRANMYLKFVLEH
jgi:tetratricopeptide (TPR) repeat protein